MCKYMLYLPGCDDQLLDVAPKCYILDLYTHTCGAMCGTTQVMKHSKQREYTPQVSHPPTSLLVAANHWCCGLGLPILITGLVGHPHMHPKCSSYLFITYIWLQASGAERKAITVVWDGFLEASIPSSLWVQTTSAPCIGPVAMLVSTWSSFLSATCNSSRYRSSFCNGICTLGWEMYPCSCI